MLQDADVQALLGALYDAVVAPRGFQDFIELLIKAFHSKGAAMMTRHSVSHDINGQWVHGTTVDSYIEEYGQEDMLAQHIATQPIALFYASNLDVPYPENFPLTRFYQEWVVPQGIAYASGATVLREGPWLTQLYLQRSPQQQPFCRAELDRLNVLVPHIQRAIQMRQRFADLELGQSFLASGFDVMAIPTLLFDEFSRIVYMNRSTESLLAGHADCWVEGGHLLTSDPAANRRLNVALSRAIHMSHGEMTPELDDVVLLRRTGRMPLILKLSPLRLASREAKLGAALLFIFDPEKTPTMTAELVMRLFDLSRSEADLAVALCAGKTLEEAALERQRSIHTIRSQLKSIFCKTGTNRQTDLVSLLLSSPAYFLAEPASQASPTAVQRCAIPARD